MEKLSTLHLKALMIVFVLILSTSVYAVPVSVIIEDNATTINSTVTHSIKAYKDMQNVTIVDYFSDAKIKDIATETEQFLGKEWIAVRITIGNINEGEEKTIEYKILEGKGEAMFGADIYYIDGEKHQLFPKKEIIDIRNENKTLFGPEPHLNDNASNSEKLIYVVLPGIIITIIILAILAFIFIKFRK